MDRGKKMPKTPKSNSTNRAHTKKNCLKWVVEGGWDGFDGGAF